MKKKASKDSLSSRAPARPAKDYTFHSSPDETLHRLRSILQDEYCRQHMNMSVVTGFIGELIVGALLKSAGHDIEHYGGQHGVDLCIPTLRVQIDVKTSRLKTELGMQLWGWALQSGSKKKHLNFTHVVCVALDDALELAGLYVLDVTDLEKFPPGVNPFKNNKRILLVPRQRVDVDAMKDLKEDQRKAVQLSETRIREGVVTVARDSAELNAHLRAWQSRAGRPGANGAPA